MQPLLGPRAIIVTVNTEYTEVLPDYFWSAYLDFPTFLAGIPTTLL